MAQTCYCLRGRVSVLVDHEVGKIVVHGVGLLVGLLVAEMLVLSLFSLRLKEPAPLRRDTASLCHVERLHFYYVDLKERVYFMSLNYKEFILPEGLCGVIVHLEIRLPCAPHQAMPTQGQLSTS